MSFAALCAEELGIRLSYRVVISLFGNHSKKAAKRIMIVGAGTSGSVIRFAAFLLWFPNKEITTR